MTKSNYKLTKEDFKQINRRSLFTFQLGWNYERMQGSGYLYSIFAALIPTIFGALAANMAINGNPTGIFIWIVAQIAVMVFRWKQLEFAYREGISLVTTMQHRLTALTDAATLLGVFMVGALVATMVNVKLSWAPSIGDVTLNMQNNLDMILPRLLPAGIVGGVYWMLGKKNMTSTKAIFIVLIVCVALSALGVISK